MKKLFVKYLGLMITLLMLSNSNQAMPPAKPGTPASYLAKAMSDKKPVTAMAAKPTAAAVKPPVAPAATKTPVAIQAPAKPATPTAAKPATPARKDATAKPAKTMTSDEEWNAKIKEIEKHDDPIRLADRLYRKCGGVDKAGKEINFKQRRNEFRASLKAQKVAPDVIKKAIIRRTQLCAAIAHQYNKVTGKHAIVPGAKTAPAAAKPAAAKPGAAPAKPATAKPAAAKAMAAKPALKPATPVKK